MVYFSKFIQNLNFEPIFSATKCQIAAPYMVYFSKFIQILNLQNLSSNIALFNNSYLNKNPLFFVCNLGNFNLNFTWNIKIYSLLISFKNSANNIYLLPFFF